MNYKETREKAMVDIQIHRQLLEQQLSFDYGLMFMIVVFMIIILVIEYI